MANDEWTTPKKLFDYQDNLYHFNVDAAATAKNKLCERFYSKKNSFLRTVAKDFDCESRIWCNPPYSMAREFADHCYKLYCRRDVCSYLLLPVRSDRIWFQQLIHKTFVTTQYYTGRIHFGNATGSAFMYNVGIIIGFPGCLLNRQWLDAGQFNKDGKGGAKS